MRTGTVSVVCIVIPLLLLLLPLADTPGDAALEKTARQLEGRLIAPCCWRQPVSIHYSPASQEIKQEIRERLAAGETPEAILNHFISLYGEQILAAPGYKGFGGFAYFFPAIFLVLGGVLVFLLIRHLRGGRESTSGSVLGSDDPDSPYLERPHREMWG